MPKSTLISNLTLYSIAHAAVDFIAIATLFTVIAGHPKYTLLIFLYNSLAFGAQFFLGLIIDKFEIPKFYVILSYLFIAFALFFGFSAPVMAVIFLGLGNAIFHVAAGSIVLNLTPKKAIAPGIFVAPGALGLLAGIIFGKAGNVAFSTYAIILSVLIIATLIIKTPKLNYLRHSPKINQRNLWLLTAVLLLSAIAIRSYVGSFLVFPWKTSPLLILLLTVGIACGKAFGGIIADRFGWQKTVVTTLLLSIPLLMLGINSPVLGILGMFLFNFTMPITLVAISNLLPGRPGLAFGLTCGFLLLGSLPSYIPGAIDIIPQYLTWILILIAAVSLFISLKAVKLLNN